MDNLLLNFVYFFFSIGILGILGLSSLSTTIHCIRLLFHRHLLFQSKLQDYNSYELYMAIVFFLLFVFFTVILVIVIFYYFSNNTL